VVYELLSGEQPFSGHSAQAVMARQMTGQPRSIRVVRPEVPPLMEAAVMRALAKQPADRPHTARRLFEQLRAGAGQTV
jgi:serine/threonine-protein kinase